MNDVTFTFLNCSGHTQVVERHIELMAEVSSQATDGNAV